jgi:hypothetical protein
VTAPEHAAEIRQAAHVYALLKLAAEGLDLSVLTATEILDLGIGAGASPASEWAAGHDA